MRRKCASAFPIDVISFIKFLRLKQQRRTEGGEEVEGSDKVLGSVVAGSRGWVFAPMVASAHEYAIGYLLLVLGGKRKGHASGLA